MSSEGKNFGYIGEFFQQKILNLIITNKRFATSIIPVLEDTYFDNKYFKLLVQIVKEYYQKYEVSPDYITLEALAKIEIRSEFDQEVFIDSLYKIREIDSNDEQYVIDTSLKFCKQKEVEKAIEKVIKIIEDGDFVAYDEIESIMNKALQAGQQSHTYIDAASNVEDVLDDDYREIIPTGISGLDEQSRGLLGKGEVGLIFAPPGVGKTTFTTAVANHAYNMGYNVLQIFFEDRIKEIQRKHFTLWSGIPSSEFRNNKEYVALKVKEAQEKSKGRLLLEKLPSDTLNIIQIKNIIAKIIAAGTKLDLVIIDYIDCIQPHSSSGNEWKDEASIMRKIEAMAGEYNFAAWVATQGSRASISSDVVTNDKVGGSVKKIAIAHVIITVAKSLYQKDNKLATMAITKSRTGKDGLVFENCIYDNEMLKIDVETDTMSLGGFTSMSKQDKQDKIRKLLGDMDE